MTTPTATRRTLRPVRTMPTPVARVLILESGSVQQTVSFLEQMQLDRIRLYNTRQSVFVEAEHVKIMAWRAANMTAYSAE